MVHEHKINTSEHYVEPEQIDFIGILVKLWKGRFIIITSICICVVLSVAYIFLAKEKWLSTSIVTQPDAGQIYPYVHALDTVYGSNASKINDVQLSIIQRFGSSFSALSETLSNKTEPEKLTIEEAVKGQGLPLKLTYTGESAESAQKILASYIQRVDDEVSKGLASDLISTIKMRKFDLQQSLTTQERVVSEQKDLRMAQINQALAVAQQSDITKPQVSQADQVSQDTMFLLGSDALQAMVKNESHRPLPFPDSYYQTRQSLLDVMNLINGENSDDIKAGEIHSYRYVMKPSLPIKRESPKRILTLFLAIILGGIIGSCIVLSRDAFINYKSSR
ncbi:LPS O-antigen chain length determinant protein WzzB [Pluralibacter gergoviae]